MKNHQFIYINERTPDGRKIFKVICKNKKKCSFHTTIWDYENPQNLCPCCKEIIR